MNHPLARALILALAGLAAEASATTVTVTALNDAGPGNCAVSCTLRDAIAVAASGDTIAFASNLSWPATITFARGQLVIDKSLTIIGPGSAKLALSADNKSRVLNVAVGTVSLAGITLRDGSAVGNSGSWGSSVWGESGGPGGPGAEAAGGCVSVAGEAALSLVQVDLRGCLAQGGQGGTGGTGSTSGAQGLSGGPGGAGAAGLGGAIYSAGPLLLVGSSIVDSKAVGGAGGTGGEGGHGTLIFRGPGGSGGPAGGGFGGAIYVTGGGYALMTNTTIASNSSGGGVGGTGAIGGSNTGGKGGSGGVARGGLVYTTATGAVRAEFSTFVDGRATAGTGGVGGSGTPGGAGGSAGAATAHSIYAIGPVVVASSVVGGPGTAHCSGNVAAQAQTVNLDSDSTCSNFTLHGSPLALFLAPPDLSAREQPAYVPRYKSMVIDAAHACTDTDGGTVAVDQRGTPRPQGAKCDLGSVEADYLFVDGFQ